MKLEKNNMEQAIIPETDRAKDVPADKRRNENKENLAAQAGSIASNPEKYKGANFDAELSYDARANEKLRDCIKKGSVPLVEMGSNDVNNENRRPEKEYTNAERTYIKVEREKVDAPTEETVMQKIVGVCTGKIEEDLEKYLHPTDRFTGEKVNAQIFGFVAKAEDSAPFSRTPTACYVNFRLDYASTGFNNPEQAVYVIRFTDGRNYEIPFSEKFGGNCDAAQPCTGNGFLGSEKVCIPEYKVFEENGQGAIVTDGYIFKVNPDGTEELVAYFDKKEHCFRECKKGEVA